MSLSVETLAIILAAIEHCLNDAVPMPDTDAMRRAWIDIRALEILTRENIA